MKILRSQMACRDSGSGLVPGDFRGQNLSTQSSQCPGVSIVFEYSRVVTGLVAAAGNRRNGVILGIFRLGHCDFCIIVAVLI